MEKKNEVLDLSFEFALAVIAYCEELEACKKFVVARQLLKAGTSIGANVREAQNAESKADFMFIDNYKLSGVPGCNAISAQRRDTQYHSGYCRT